jgi:hypothetical protein
MLLEYLGCDELEPAAAAENGVGLSTGRQPLTAGALIRTAGQNRYVVALTQPGGETVIGVGI